MLILDLVLALAFFCPTWAALIIVNTSTQSAFEFCESYMHFFSIQYCWTENKLHTEFGTNLEGKLPGESKVICAISGNSKFSIPH